jgi:hypothetical protein
MKKESLRYSSLPCERLESDQFNEQTYRVASTGAVVNLSSSISLIYLYCSRLPSDGLVRLLLPLYSIFIYLHLMNLKICFCWHQSGPLTFFILFIIHPIPIWFFKLSGTLNQLQGGTNKKECCIFPRVALSRLFLYKAT